MQEIRKKIAEILLSEEDVLPDETAPEEMVEAYDGYEYEELYSDLYVIIRNMEDYYGTHSRPKAALLLESFLLESMVLLKKDPEVILVESGDYFVKATSYTPDGEGVLRLFENVVLINSMAELYNQALVEYDLPAMEYGIGLATIPAEAEPETESTEPLTFADQDELTLLSDPSGTAFKFASMANTDEYEPIIINDMAYELLLEIDQPFFEENLVKAMLEEEDMVIYHGNIISDETME
jgi:hypothetical protein